MANGEGRGARINGNVRSFASENVAAVFASVSEAHRPSLLRLRDAIFDCAETDQRIGQVTETLKWGQPSYLTARPKSGTTIRLAETKDGRYGLFVPCSTSLIETFGGEFGDAYALDGTRGVLFDAPLEIVPDAVRRLIHQAMVYHLKS